MNYYKKVIWYGSKNNGSKTIATSSKEKTKKISTNDISFNQFKLSNYRGTPFILDLMAVRCPPCEQQMPELQKVKKKLGNDVVILSIDVDGAGGYESAQDVKDAFGTYIKEEWMYEQT